MITSWVFRVIFWERNSENIFFLCGIINFLFPTCILFSPLFQKDNLLQPLNHLESLKLPFCIVGPPLIGYKDARQRATVPGDSLNGHLWKIHTICQPNYRDDAHEKIAAVFCRSAGAPSLRLERQHSQ